MTKFTKWKKWQKIIQGLYPNHMHISRPWKTCAKFQKDRCKIVWGVALTRYPLSIHFHRIWGQEMTKFAKWKMWQKLMQGLYPNLMHIFRPWRKRAKFQKDRYKIVLGVPLTRYPLSIHWGKKKWQSKKISNDQELIQSDPTSRPQNQKGNN